MQNFLSTIPGLIVTIGGVIAVAVVGGLYIVGLVRGKKDSSDDRLIKILEGTVNALETKVDNQKKEHDEILTGLSKQISDLTSKVDELERENETLTKVLQGRDEQTQVFYKKAFEAMEVSNKTFALVETMNKNHTELMKMLVEHLKPGVTINNQPQK
jgi:predicted RNase H-like nuclease (RuvC/YqgF family)